MRFDTMLHSVIETASRLLYLGLPVFPTALIHGLCRKHHWLHLLKRPLDLGRHFRGKRVFGDNKTWRGAALYVICCTLGGTLQGCLQEAGFVPDWLLFFDYRSRGHLIGLLIGVGMSLGELPNSFLKRQLNIPPGHKGHGARGVFFLFLDQVDMTLGIWLMLAFLTWPPWDVFLLSLVLTFAAHMVVSILGRVLNMRETWV